MRVMDDDDRVDREPERDSSSPEPDSSSVTGQSEAGRAPENVIITGLKGEGDDERP